MSWVLIPRNSVRKLSWSTSMARGLPDESLGSLTNCQAVARQPQTPAFMVYDDTIHKNFAVRQVGSSPRESDTFDESRSLGAPAVVAPTLEALAEEMQTWGVYGQGVVTTIREYNQAVEDGRATHLRIPRRAKANPIVQPPFYALGVTPGVTFTMGGLCINTDTEPMPRCWTGVAVPSPGCTLLAWTLVASTTSNMGAV